MKDDYNNHVCERCHRERTERDQIIADRMDLWNTAVKLIEARQWPEDLPPDPIRVALFLIGEE